MELNNELRQFIDNIFDSKVKVWEHDRQPSPQTINILNSMEKEFNNLKLKMMEVQKDVEFIKEAEKRTELILNNFCEKADGLYARKTVVDDLEISLKENYRELRDEQRKIMWKAIAITGSVVGGFFAIIMFLLNKFIKL